MSPTRRTTVSLGIVAVTAVVSVVVYPNLPQGMAIHFDSGGQPDSYLPKPLAVALLPALAVGFTGFSPSSRASTPSVRTSSTSNGTTTSLPSSRW